VLRVSHQDLQTRLEALQEELSTTNMELEKSKILNETLEADLEKVQQEASNAFDPSAMSVAGTYTSRYPQSSFAGTRRGRASSPTSSIISGFDPAHAPQQTSLSALRAGDSPGGPAGILPMVTAQRDRFKQRAASLDAELQKSYTTVSTLRTEVAALQKDNLALYEKTRYVSAYNRAPAPANSTPLYASDNTSSGLTMDRYRSAYETNISPFAAFRGRESARAFRRMHVLERMVFRVTRLVLQTRTSRNVFAAYLFGLHFMVFYMLFSYASPHTGAVVDVAAAGGPIAVADGTVWQKEGLDEAGT
jgi:homeobox protein cut-like